MSSLVLAGGYGSGIHVLCMDNGMFRPLYLLRDCENPTYLAASGNRVYAVNETPDKAELAAFILSDTHELSLVNRLHIPGAGACHLSLHQSGKFLFAANYMSGDAVSCSIGDDGGLVKVLSHVSQEGDASHCHCSVPSPDGGWLLTVNLGTDAVYSYPVSGGVLSAEPQVFQAELGQGLRHVTFHPNRHVAYLVTEVGNRVIVLSFVNGNGALREIQQMNLLPKGHAQQSFASGVVLSPDGKYLYAANRGFNHISVFAVDAKSGLLSPAGHYNCGGDWPRDLCISSSGDILVVANQRSSAIVSFEICKNTGAVGNVIDKIEMPAPACVLWRDRVNG